MVKMKISCVQCGILLVPSFLRALPDARRRFLAELEEFAYSGSASVNSRFLALLPADIVVEIRDRNLLENVFLVDHICRVLRDVHVIRFDINAAEEQRNRIS